MKLGKPPDLVGRKRRGFRSQEFLQRLGAQFLPLPEEMENRRLGQAFPMGGGSFEAEKVLELRVLGVAVTVGTFGAQKEVGNPSLGTLPNLGIGVGPQHLVATFRTEEKPVGPTLHSFPTLLAFEFPKLAFPGHLYADCSGGELDKEFTTRCAGSPNSCPIAVVAGAMKTESAAVP